MNRTAHPDTDLRSALEVVEAGRGVDSVGDGLSDAVLSRLRELVPCDIVSFTDFDVATQIVHVDQECVDSQITTYRGDEPDPDDAFFRHYWQTECCSYPTRTGDDVTVTQRSDFYTDLEWRHSPMFIDLFSADGITHELMCCLPTQRTRTARIVFFRTGSTRFEDRDRLVLSLLRPHLAEMYGRGRSVSAPRADLTPRQWELMCLVAAGHSNSEIAKQLYLTANTVRKHLENIYARLGVGTRTAAVARAFPYRPTLT